MAAMNVSVVIPLFNAKAWIEETLASVRDQREVIEVVLIDDRSQDDSARVASAFLDRFDMAGKVITTEENVGPSAARNLGWQSASGEWIQFLDADDLLAPRKIQLQYDRTQSVSDEVAVLYSPWRRIGLEKGRWCPYGPVIHADLDDDPLVGVLLDREFGRVGPTLIRRRALEVVGGFSAKMTLGEDLDLMLRIAMAGFTFQSVASSEPLFFYREVSDSLWHRSDEDVNARRYLVHAVRNAELFVRSTRPERLPYGVRRAIAIDYARPLRVLRDGDPAEFEEVLSWIHDLHVRSALPGSRVSAHVLAMSIGLSNALKVKFAIRETLDRLRAVRSKSTNAIGGGSH